MARTPVQAAGGIVLRQAKPPLIAVVRLRKRNEWVLPKGKLDDGETPREAAEREVNEETGHDVIVHEFLGTLVYESAGRSKIVQYWRMQADGEQVYELMTDIREVDWLPLEVALTRLSRASERAFLEHVGPLAVAATLADLSKRKAKALAATKPVAATKPALATKLAAATKSVAATKPAEATKPAAATKAAPATKRRTRPAAPAKPPAAPVPLPAAPMPVQLAEQATPPMELPPVAPGMAIVIASEVAEGAGAVETPEPALVETQAPLPVEQSEPVASADPEDPTVARAECDASASEPEAPDVETAEEADSAAIDNSETGADEPRRKTLTEKLRNWLGSVA